MNQLVSHLGVDTSSNLSVFLFCTIFTFAVVTVLWVVGLFQGNHSMMDGWYGFAFAVPALFAYLIVDAAVGDRGRCCCSWSCCTAVGSAGIWRRAGAAMCPPTAAIRAISGSPNR